MKPHTDRLPFEWTRKQEHFLEFVIGSPFDQCRYCGRFFPTIHGKNASPAPPPNCDGPSDRPY
jgi:hypothetical protein